jgi:putative membrane protein
VTLPLFLVALGGVVTGLVIWGFVWEWIREAKHRRDASRKARDVRRLEREMNKLKAEKNKDKDEILAILDEAV